MHDLLLARKGKIINGNKAKKLSALSTFCILSSVETSVAGKTSAIKEEVKNPNSSELLHIIFNYISRIANERDIDKLLICLADMGRDLITADRCTVWLADAKNKTLWTRVAHGLDRFTIPLDKGIAGSVVSAGHSLIINDPYSDDRFDKEVDKKTGYFTRSILALPIMNSEGAIIGVYQAINKLTNKNRFTAKDQERLLLAASYTGKQLEAAMLREEIELTQKEIIFTLAETGEMRSKETGNHVKRVSEFCRIIATKSGLDDNQIELLRNASPLHDIGKIAIPDAILLKAGALTDSDREIMKSHTTLGYEMLKHSERRLIKAAASIAYEHHEKWNGKGYPRGLRGNEISLFGRIAAIADVFDALACERVYKKAWPVQKIVTLFQEESGEQFDPDLVPVFLDNIDEMVDIKDKLKDTLPDSSPQH